MKAALFLTLTFLFSFPLVSQTILFEDNFEEASFDPAWTVLPGAPDGVVEISDGSGFEDSRGVIMGKVEAGGFVTNRLDLNLNLAGQSQVALTFKIGDYFDETQAEDGLYLSNNGGATFTKILSFQPSIWCDIYGEYPPLDIDELAAANGLSLTSQFVIRFQHRGNDNFFNDGLYIDDVKVYVPELTYATLPFSDNFEAANFGSSWTWSFADQTNTLATIPTRPTNVVEIVNNAGPDDSRAVRMGKACADGYSTNALDLHLNLTGHTQVAMTFKIGDYFDETQIDDALYFSDNGGASFVKVLSFQPSVWCDIFGEYPPLDIDELAAAHGLSLTGQFVVRFQQHGNDNFFNDGLYIDDVKVYVSELTYATLPFSDNFEAANFGSSWKRSFADQTNTLAAIATRPTNIVDLADNAGIDDSRGVRMGKACADGFSTNALDLHLKLAGHTQVSMTFHILDIFDDTQIDDGLYFSDNGGLTFKKVYSFDFSNTPNVYTNYAINVSELASANNMELTDQFIVRFQQHGNDNLFNDGILLDDVNVTGTISSPVEAMQHFVKIFPNPTAEALFLDFSNYLQTERGSYEIKDLLGGHHLSGPISTAINVSHLPPGVFVLTIRTSENTISHQFVKM
ncbi:MAG: T9SS type A sorting domain-containing protein [Saprospiraceae bacterium]|nr:T9SS type A sorting domain-containing protein [Saprospiraceae bacterium]